GNGPAAPDPRDDVYGLACVAYELFAGRHPFNSNTALEASAAGLRPAPIPRLDARSWEALARGLALRREQRTSNVATFLAELGVTGRERLGRAADADRGKAAAATAAAPAVPYDDADWDWSEQTRATPSVRAASMGAANVEHYYELFKIRGNDKRTGGALRWIPWVVALALGIGAAVYWDFG